MDEEQLNERLNQISTMWTLLKKAHSGPPDDREEAQTALLEHYQRAIYRYLLRAVGNDIHAAEELFQEFALRFIRGDFRNATPDRGRFRDLVRTALINLVINHSRRRERERKVVPGQFDRVDALPDSFDLDRSFLEHWREALLHRAWLALSQQQAGDGPPFYATLRVRREHPEATARQLADLLNQRLKPAKPFTEVNLRKTLQRARERFSDLLRAEVARSVGSSDGALVEEELGELGLLRYMQKGRGNRTESIPPA